MNGKADQTVLTIMYHSPPKHIAQLEPLDLNVEDNGETTILYIPSSCHRSLVNLDSDNRRKLFEFEADSGATILIENPISISGTSDITMGITKVVITGNQIERDVASSM